jgi:hypothetical protein
MNVKLPFGMNGETGSEYEFWIVLGVCVVLTALFSILLVKMTDKIKIRTPKQVKGKRRK